MDSELEVLSNMVQEDDKSNILLLMATVVKLKALKDVLTGEVDPTKIAVFDPSVATDGGKRRQCAIAIVDDVGKSIVDALSKIKDEMETGRGEEDRPFGFAAAWQNKGKKDGNAT